MISLYYDVLPQATPGAVSTVRVASGTTATAARGPVVGIPAAQLYYWKKTWQENEAVAVAELERGEGRRFSTSRDAISWLMSDED